MNNSSAQFSITPELNNSSAEFRFTPELPTGYPVTYVNAAANRACVPWPNIDRNDYGQLTIQKLDQPYPGLSCAIDQSQYLVTNTTRLSNSLNPQVVMCAKDSGMPYGLVDPAYDAWNSLSASVPRLNGANSDQCLYTIPNQPTQTIGRTLATSVQHTL